MSEPTAPVPGEIRVLVIDDSAYNRQTITTMLSSVPGIRVVARAADGDEGLRRVFEHSPDIITLDLEMPKMDGFTFLRILMQRRPTPVVVISSYARKENVFKALELGALDFIAKPTHKISTEILGIEQELVAKVRLVTQLKVVALADRTRLPTPMPPPAPDELLPASAGMRVIAIGASTGGPPALAQIFSQLDARVPMAVLVSQHMPPKFTAAFAERLDRGSAFEVREAKSGDVLRPGLALIAPGASHLTIERGGAGGPNVVRAKVEPAPPEDRYVPSIDKLFASVARTFGSDAMAVVLTGMGGDGTRGVKAIKEAGGRTLAEAQESAVIFGMPDEAIKTGAIDQVVPLRAIADAILEFGRIRAGDKA